MATAPATYPVRFAAACLRLLHPEREDDIVRTQACSPVNLRPANRAGVAEGVAAISS